MAFHSCMMASCCSRSCDTLATNTSSAGTGAGPAAVAGAAAVDAGENDATARAGAAAAAVGGPRARRALTSALRWYSSARSMRATLPLHSTRSNAVKLSCVGATAPGLLVAVAAAAAALSTTSMASCQRPASPRAGSSRPSHCSRSSATVGGAPHAPRVPSTANASL